MSQTRPNKIVTITNDEIYDLATHQARLADSANVVIKVSSAAERDALPKTPGMSVTRLDVLGQPVEIWDGSVWNRMGPKVIPGPNSQVGAQLANSAFTTGGFQPIFMPGTQVLVTDASGFFSIDYPAAFPNGILFVSFWNGDATQGRDMIVSTAGSPFTQTLSVGYGSILNSDGTAKASATVRINYLAVGW